MSKQLLDFGKESADVNSVEVNTRYQNTSKE